MASTSSHKQPPRWRRRVRMIHRWLGLLVGLQLLLWIAGGLVMSSLDLHEVRGRHLANSADPASLKVESGWLHPAVILKDQVADSIQLRTWLGRPVYQVQHQDQKSLWDARSGLRLSPIGADQAKAVALADYVGTATIRSVNLISEAKLETRGHNLPLWQIEFADSLTSTLYISAHTGLVVARRNNLWRVFDFVWMLHIMDYEQRDNFNHPLLVLFAASTLVFALSGLAMLWFSFHRRSHR